MQETYKIILTASDQTREAFDSVKSNTSSLTDKLEIARGAVAAVGIAAASAAAVMIKNSLESADAMSKAAQKVGTTTEMLSGLKYAADMSDLSFEALQKNMGKLANNAYQAATSGGTAAAAFDNLGITVKGADGHLKDSGTLLEEVAEKFAAMPDSAEKSALAIEMFGKSGLEMIPFLNSGKEGLQEMREEAERMGLVIDGNVAKQAEAFNDNLMRISKSSEGLANRMMADVVPALNEVADAYVAATRDSDLLSNASSVVKTTFEAVVIVGANLAYMLKEIGAEAVGISTQIVALAHLDFESFSGIGAAMKKDAEAARKSLDEFEQRILHPPKRPETDTKRDGRLPFLEAESTNKEMDQILEKARRMTEELVSAHQTAAQKIADRYKEMEESLTASGAAGNEQRKLLRAAYDQYMAEEQAKQEEERQKQLDKETEQSNKLIETQQEKFAKMKEQADQSVAFGEERENLRYEAQLRELERDRQALEDKHLWNLQSEDKYQAAMAALKRAHQARQMQSDIAMVNFGRAIKQGEYTDAMSMAAKMTAGIASHSRAAFEINKVASIATAIMNTYKGISGVLADFPGPAGWAMAAAQAAIGFVQVDMINSTQFGGGAANVGGGGVPSLATAPGIPVAPQQDQSKAPAVGVEAQASRTVNLIISGNDSADFFSAKTVRDLIIPALNEAAGDGVTINVTKA